MVLVCGLLCASFFSRILFIFNLVESRARGHAPICVYRIKIIETEHSIHVVRIQNCIIPIDVYAVIWVVNVLGYFESIKSEKKIQFYFSSFSIHEAMWFFWRPFTKFSLVNVKYTRDIYAKREVNYRKRKKLRKKPKRNRVTHRDT